MIKNPYTDRFGAHEVSVLNDLFKTELRKLRIADKDITYYGKTLKLSVILKFSYDSRSHQWKTSYDKYLRKLIYNRCYGFIRRCFDAFTRMLPSHFLLFSGKIKRLRGVVF